MALRSFGEIKPKLKSWSMTQSLYGRKMSIQQIKAYHTKIRGEPRNRFSFMVETTLWRCTDCGALWEKKVEHDCKDDLSRVWSQSDHHRKEKSG